MSVPVLFAGRIHCSLESFEAAQAKPVMEVFVEADDGVSFLPEHRTAAQLFSDRTARSVHADGAWTFSCELHEDDWFNTDHEFLINALHEVKDEAGDDVVFACDAEGHFDSIWRLSPDAVQAVEPLPQWKETARNLVAGARVDELIELLQTSSS